MLRWGMGQSFQRVTRFHALGAADLKGPEGTALQSVLARPKLLGVLSYLAAASPRGFKRRDTVTGLFWGELSQERARGALRQALYHLRQSLGEGVVVTRGDEEIGLDVDRFWSDVAAFEDALERGDREEALELYRGDLLQGFFVAGAPEFERWLDGRRGELRERARVAAWELAQGAEAEGKATEAARWARQALRLEPLDEELLRQVIELLGRLGDRSGAVREYEAFAARLAEELELEPAPETQTLIEAIRSRPESELGRLAGKPAGALAVDAPAASAPSAPGAPPEVGAGLDTRNRAHLLNTRAFRLGLVAGAALVIGLGIVWAFGYRGGAQELDERRVVVAVFENRTGDPSLDPLGYMVADWVTEGLDQIAVVDVVPSTTGLEPRPDLGGSEGSGPSDIRALAQATDAGSVITGAYYRSGDSIEFQAQVVDARGGDLLSAVAPVSGSLDAPGPVVDTLRQRIAGTVATVFDSRLAGAAPGSKPPSLEAYRAYLEGHRAFHRIPMRMREALTYFYQAVTLDTAFIAPRFYIIFAHANLGEWQAADSNARLLMSHRPRMSNAQRQMLDWQLALLRGDRTAALEAARVRGGPDVGVEAFRANRPREAVDVLAGTPELSELFFQRLTLMEAYHALGEYQRELREAERGRRDHPGRMRMLDAEVRALAALGRIDEMEERVEESLLLPPEDVILAVHVMMSAAEELRAHGFPAASFRATDRAIQWHSSRPAEEAASWEHRFSLARAYYIGERWDEAAALFEELASEVPSSGEAQVFLGVLAARRGDREAALRIEERLSELGAPGPFRLNTYWQARIAALLGDRERAVALLREAHARGLPFTVFVHREMDFEPLHDYEPFQQFIEPKG